MSQEFKKDNSLTDNEIETHSGIIEYFRRIHILASAFPAFQNKNYRLYFAGQLVSVTGTWLQIVAQGWLVLKLTNSAFMIGLIAAAGTLPSLFLTPFGGVIVDKFPKKKILLFTQSSSMLLAFLLGTLTILHFITSWEIAVIAFLLGLVNSIDSPARQAFVPEMVGREYLSSAIAMNSALFNAGRVIGPALAGMLIALTGIGSTFIINGLSFMAVLIALLHIHVERKMIHINQNAISAIKEGFVYSFSHPVIRTLLVFTGISSIFGWSCTTELPLIARNEFQLGASGLGYLYAAIGVGSILATLVLPTLSKKYSPIRIIVSGNALFAVSITIFSLTRNLHLAIPMLFISGFGLISLFVTINTTIQSLVRDELRGRAMSLYILMFIGLNPVGYFLVGLLSENFGTGFAIRLGAVIVFLFGSLLFFYRKRIGNVYTEYISKME